MNKRIPFDKMYPQVGICVDAQDAISVECKGSEPGVCRTLYTTIRVKDDDGKWYKMNIAETWIDRDEAGLPLHFIRRFYAVTYNYLVLYKINKNALLLDGRRVFELDEDQRSEAERVKAYLEP